jgi:hypothetical protein
MHTHLSHSIHPPTYFPQHVPYFHWYQFPTHMGRTWSALIWLNLFLLHTFLIPLIVIHLRKFCLRFYLICVLWNLFENILTYNFSRRLCIKAHSSVISNSALTSQINTSGNSTFVISVNSSRAKKNQLKLLLLFFNLI